MFLRMLLVFCQSEAECSINEVLDKKRVYLCILSGLCDQKKNKPSQGNSMRHQHLCKRDALGVESCHIDACDLVRTSPLSHSRTSPRAERRTAERSGAKRSGTERSAAERSAAERVGE